MTTPTHGDCAIARGVLAKHSRGRFVADALRTEHSLDRDLGIDSLRLVLVILEIEAQLGRKVFVPEQARRLATVGDIERLVEAAS
jgi:acyl carrier protein